MASDLIDQHTSQASLISSPLVCADNGRFRKRFAIGGVSLGLAGESARDVDGGIEMRQFFSEGSVADITADIRWDDEVHAQLGPALFDSGATWRLFSHRDRFSFEFVSPVLGRAPYKRMDVDRSFSRAMLTLSRYALRGYSAISPCEYPVCELLITNYLACRGMGVEVHGCGLIDSEGAGYLFLGHSGHGKSTTARLWTAFRNAAILSDDRMVLRLHQCELWMYGTPWHGEAAFASPARAKLDRIFLLQHGTSNRFSLLPQPRAIAEVFARSFPPFYSFAAIEKTVEFLRSALESAPCYEFDFLPDQSSIAAVLGFRD